MTTETENGPDAHVVERLVEAGALTGPDDPDREEKLNRFRTWMASSTNSGPRDAGMWAHRLRDEFLKELTADRQPAAYSSED